MLGVGYLNDGGRQSWIQTSCLHWSTVALFLSAAEFISNVQDISLFELESS
jgi:hypothetical protein